MAIFNTYKEAVLANGGTNGVYTTGLNWGGLPEHRGFFRTGAPIVSGDRGWVECNPADYLETLDSFLASGKLLVSGDMIVDFMGYIVNVSVVELMNRPDSEDCRYFILQAAADQVETPEEKEAFDAIDTTPQQVESLSETEWNPKSGQEVYIAQINTLAGVKDQRYYVREYWCDSDYQREYLQCGILFPTAEEAELKIKSILGIQVETPAEIEEREREESARELYFLSNKVMAGTHMINHYSFQESKDVWLAIVDETGYRKERKQ